MRRHARVCTITQEIKPEPALASASSCQFAGSKYREIHETAWDIIEKKSISVSAPWFLAQGLQVLWNFLDDSHVFCSNEMTLGESWILTKAMIRRPGFSAPPPATAPEQEEGLETVNHRSCLHDDASIKTPKVGRLGGSGG